LVPMLHMDGCSITPCSAQSAKQLSIKPSNLN
jgi:hypothetical protein